MTTQPAPVGNADHWVGPEHRSPFWQWAGIVSKRLEPGLVELHMKTRPEMINLGNGSMHGGMTAALIDSAVAAVIASVYRVGVDITGMTTVDLNVTFLETVRPESSLVCRAKLIRKGRTVCVGDAEVRDQDGRLCAVGRATYMIFRKQDAQKPS
jgi:acyl-CoA thioesterase